MPTGDIDDGYYCGGSGGGGGGGGAADSVGRIVAGSGGGGGDGYSAGVGVHLGTSTAAAFDAGATKGKLQAEEGVSEVEPLVGFVVGGEDLAASAPEGSVEGGRGSSAAGGVVAKKDDKKKRRRSIRWVQTLNYSGCFVVLRVGMLGFSPCRCVVAVVL